jgi:Anti-sigma-K factor rskA
VGACEQFQAQCAAYARGALRDQERAAFEAHLATGCPACLRAVRMARPIPPESGLSWWMIAAIAAIVGASVAWALQARRERKELAALHEQVDRALADQQRLIEQAKQVTREQRAAAILSDPRTVQIPLQPKEAGLPALKAYWNARLGIVLMGAKVPSPTGERVFELWLVPRALGAKPLSQGLFRPDAQARVVLVVPGTPAPESVMPDLEISGEPSGGSPQPTRVLWRATRKECPADESAPPG